MKTWWEALSHNSGGLPALSSQLAFPELHRKMLTVAVTQGLFLKQGFSSKNIVQEKSGKSKDKEEIETEY